MNALPELDRPILSTDVGRNAATADDRSPDVPTGDLRLSTTGLVGREAAISAGYHALVLLVTSKQVSAPA